MDHLYFHYNGFVLQMLCRIGLTFWEGLFKGFGRLVVMGSVVVAVFGVVIIHFVYNQ